MVDIERRAVLDGDKDEYLSQIDKGDRDWYHFQMGEFDNDSELTSEYSCVRNVRFGPGPDTAMADVSLDSCPGRYHVGMFFRRIAGHWYHSQPALEEQGLRDTRTIGPFHVTFHAMDESYLPELARFAPAVYDRVSTFMGITKLDVDVNLVSRPTDMPASAFTTIALYYPRTREMSMLSPFFWPNGDGTEAQLDDEIRTTLTHEFTHHAEFVLAGLNVPHWLNEGIAVYVSGEPTTEYVRMVQQFQIAGELAPPEDLDTMLLDGATAPLAYAEGYSFVHFLTGRLGDSFIPELLVSLRQTDDLNASLNLMTRKSLDGWWQDWLASVKR